MMNILLFGASGFIGRHIYHSLSATPHHIITITSNQLDFTAPIVPDGLFDDVDMVINMVGVMSDADSMEAIHHHTPLLLAKHAKASKVAHWLNLSALGADEYSPVAFVGSKGRGDKALLALADDDFKVSIIRPSLVFGQGGASTQLFLAIAKLPIWILPNGGNFMIQPVHINDVTQGFLNIVQSDRCGIINMAAEPILFKDYLCVLSNNFYHNKPKFILSIPIKCAIFFLKIIQPLIHHPLFSVDNLTLLTHVKVVDNHIFIQILQNKLTPAHQFYF